MLSSSPCFPGTHRLGFSEREAMSCSDFLLPRKRLNITGKRGPEIGLGLRWGSQGSWLGTAGYGFRVSS